MSRRGYCAACHEPIPDHVGGCPDAGGFDNLYEAEAAEAARQAFLARREAEL